MSQIDIFISPARIITLDHTKKLKYNTFVGNTGHFDNEIDLAGSERVSKARKSTTASLRRSLSSPSVDHGVLCCITPLALQMWRFNGFFALFPDFKRVRSSAASAEITRQVEISSLSARQMAHGESSRTPAHGRRRLMSWRSPRRRWTPTSAVFQNLLMGEGSKESSLRTF